MFYERMLEYVKKTDFIILQIKEQRILDNRKERETDLRLSFFHGFCLPQWSIFFPYTVTPSAALTDAVYDASELVFIALLLFLTPLFHKPVSEKHPYGYFQVESIFVLIKGVMMLSVTMGVSAEVLDSALSGGNPVNTAQVSLFQFCLGAASVLIFLVMKRMNRSLSSPTIQAEPFGMETGYCIQYGNVSCFFCIPVSGKDSPWIYCSVF